METKVDIDSHSCVKKPRCQASPWRLFLTVIPGPLPGRLMACNSRWEQRWVSKPLFPTTKLEVWKPWGEEDSPIETDAKNKDNNDARLDYVAFFSPAACHIVVVFLFVFLRQCITCRSPSSLLCPSVSACDYVTKQKSPIRSFIGGAHLWLILHNGSPIISALTRRVI